ncbi:MAG: activator of (R)-2-hydroxyglutaryl-CoA dehydratase [Myxococcales bacterium FL481]|nr:MAG: activator of (R)-2-hydroxyglutaryl-CoA dehydratase [Myxococcales bacterium FL481]
MNAPISTPSNARRSPLLNVAQDPQVSALLAEAEREFLAEEGVNVGSIHEQFRRPVERDFIRSEVPHTTLLFGGLTFRHERLIQGVFQSLGYNTKVVPTPNVDAFQKGKEYGNNGQCNPTYFTVGNLVQYLEHLRDDEGMTVQEINDSHIFLTAGACGPCRFGMYEAEYRLALRNAGFDGFRVVLFQQKGGLTQGDMEAGLKMDLDFFLGLLNAMNMGDLMNEVSNQIRPFETSPGQTDQVLGEALDFLHATLRDHKKAELDGDLGDWLKSRNKSTFDKTRNLVKFVDQLTTEDFREPLRQVSAQFDQIEVDRLQPKPIVKITGEFWAQTTDGDGNFNMFRFLQAEGAEIIVEPIATWIAYMIWQGKIKSSDRRSIDEKQAPAKWYELRRIADEQVAYLKKRGMLAVADKVFRREYERMREALGGTAHSIVDMWEMEDIAHEYYHSRSEGGEGHLEVSKNIYYTAKGLCHMVLSLKPFGCMPSTQSDGAQSAVVNNFKDMIFLPIETSGEGEINAHSRVQMALGEAKAKAKSEFNEVLDAMEYSLDDLRAYVSKHDELRRPMYHVPHYEGLVGTAARFARHLSERMRDEGVRPGAPSTAA